MSVLTTSTPAVSATAAPSGPESGSRRVCSLGHDNEQSGASQAAQRLIGLEASGNAGQRERSAYLGQINQQRHHQEHADLSPIRSTDRAAHERHPPPSPADAGWVGEMPPDGGSDESMAYETVSHDDAPYGASAYDDAARAYDGVSDNTFDNRADKTAGAFAHLPASKREGEARKPAKAWGLGYVDQLDHARARGDAEGRRRKSGKHAMRQTSESTMRHHESEPEHPGRETFGEDRILARRKRRSIPRLVAKPWYAVAVMLILATALCASMTMLVRQSMNYHAAAAQQANSNAASPGYDASVNAPKNSHSDKSKSIAPSDAPTSRDTAESTGDTTFPPAAASSQSTVESGLVNLNTASLQELDTLAGVGPVTAQRILDHRQRIGRFTSVDQLLDVSGIGPKTLEKLRPQVSAS